MPRNPKVATAGLWTVQILLALLFLFAGGVKLVMPLAPVALLTGLPVAFLRSIAVAEILGALGLILPGLLRVRRELTPLAAVGLVGVMTGAVTITVATQGLRPALVPAVVAVVLLTVIRGRRQWRRASRPASRSYEIAADEGIRQAA